MTRYALLLLVGCGSGDKPAPRETPPSPAPRDSGPVDPVLQLASDAGEVCALRASGRRFCWGAGEGRIEASAVHEVSSRGAITPSDGKTHRRLYRDGTCTLDAGGVIRCSGELDALTRRSFPPTRVSGVGAVHQLSPVGLDTLCALQSSGGIVCWSEEALLAALDDKPSTPMHIPGEPGDPWVRVVEGCALRRSGRVFCWGDDSRGQVTGIGDVRTRAAKLVDPASVKVLGSWDEDPWCGVVANGSVVCWSSETKPAMRLPPPASADDEVVQIVQAMYGACALRRSGDVVCFITEDTARFDATPRAIPELDDATSIASAGGRFCAVRRTGAVACGVTGPDQKPLANIAGIDDAEQVSVAERFACALDKSGAVACWSHGGRAKSPAGLPPLRRIAVARGGDRHAMCGIDRDGRAWCSGTGDCGERTCEMRAPGALVDLGGSSEDGRSVFHAVTAAGAIMTWGRYDKPTVEQRDDITNAIAVRAGRYASCAMTRDGGVWCWGAVGSHLNDGHRSFVKQPVEVRLD